MLEAIGLALAGRAGARLATRLGLTASRSNLLWLVRALPDPQVQRLTAVGVDDFALRRGHVYGTVLIDINSHRPVDLLEGRDAETLADWLRAHPEIEIVCRDRAGAYAEGARRGAPTAVQVADRWHLSHNLAEAVEKTVTQHRGDLRYPDPDSLNPTAHDGDTRDEDGQAAVAETAPVENRLVVRTRERHALDTARPVGFRGAALHCGVVDVAQARGPWAVRAGVSGLSARTAPARRRVAERATWRFDRHGSSVGKRSFPDTRMGGCARGVWHGTVSCAPS